MTEVENKLALANLGLLVSNLNDQVSEIDLDVSLMFYLEHLNDETESNAFTLAVDDMLISIEVLPNDVKYGVPVDYSNRTFDGWDDLLNTVNTEPGIRLKNLDWYVDIANTDITCIVSDFGTSTYRITVADKSTMVPISNGESLGLYEGVRKIQIDFANK